MSYLKSLREQRGLTRRRLSAITGINEITLFTMEMGKYMPSVDKAYKLAKYYGIDFETFCKNSNFIR